MSAQASIDGRYDGHVPIGGDGGDGHFSAVFRATATGCSTPVALKFFVDRGDPYRLDSFRREGHMLASQLAGEDKFVQLADEPREFTVQLQVQGIGSMTQTYPYLAFEWMQHGHAGELCKQPPTSLPTLLRTLGYFGEMLSCTRRLHHLQCRHRDLKPENFFVAKGRIIKLGDFGTTRLVSPGAQQLLQSYSSPQGDLRYAAPERLANVDHATDPHGAADRFSLGAILFELLTGELFSAQTIGQFMQFFQIFQNTPDHLKNHNLHGWLDGLPNFEIDCRYYNPDIHKCAAPVLNQLLRSLGNPDYRKRTMTLARAAKLTRICELIVRHELRTQEKLHARRHRRLKR